MDVVIAALSARPLLAAADRDGLTAGVVDAFADRETRRLAQAWQQIPAPSGQLVGSSLRRAVAAVAPPGVGLVYGSGVDAEDLAEVVGQRPLFGNPPAVATAATRPDQWLPLWRQLGVVHPETRLEPPRSLAGWLVKRVGAAGGGHIRPAGSGLAAGYYWQRRLNGRAVSLQALCDGRQARVFASCDQWTAPTPAQPFRFGGIATPTVDGAWLAAGHAAVAKVTAALGLVGLNSFDFIASGNEAFLLEVNPRPGISLDLFADTLPGLLRRHLDVCTGTAAAAVEAGAGGRALAFIYAATAAVVPATGVWPAWAHDIPVAGTMLAAGDPVCTVSAAADDTAAACRLVEQRQRRIALLLDSFAPAALAGRTR